MKQTVGIYVFSKYNMMILRIYTVQTKEVILIILQVHLDIFVHEFEALH